MIKLALISAALVLSTPALCQDSASDSAAIRTAIEGLTAAIKNHDHVDADAINKLASAINNYEAGIEQRQRERQYWEFVRSHGYAPDDPCKGTHSSWACQ